MQDITIEYASFLSRVSILTRDYSKSGIFFIQPSLYLQFHSTSLTSTHSDPMDRLLPQ